MYIDDMNWIWIWWWCKCYMMLCKLIYDILFLINDDYMIYDVDMKLWCEFLIDYMKIHMLRYMYKG